jgi:hypothetical protein
MIAPYGMQSYCGSILSYVETQETRTDGEITLIGVLIAQHGGIYDM